MLKSMKVGERGQVTIPKEIRERFGMGPETEVEFKILNGSVVLKKAPKKLNLARWKGRCKQSFAELGYESVDRFIEDVRGRSRFLPEALSETGDSRSSSLTIADHPAHS